MSSYIFTSESVAEGHPDKVCDLISDTLLDFCLQQNPFARVAIETLVTNNQVILAGEIRGVSLPLETIESLVRRTIYEIGYEQEGFHWQTVQISSYIHEQSEDIAIGVDQGTIEGEGAGDQGIIFGYASNETDAYMPAPLYYAHQLLLALKEIRVSNKSLGLGPDAKSQVSLLYEEGKPKRATTMVISTQHKEEVHQSTLKSELYEMALKVFPKGWMCAPEAFYVNPSGRFVKGGPAADTGLTGRKIIVDTYGGAAPHGGGAFSGKDPTKVDRSAAYALRYLAKNVVAAGLAEKCTLQVAYGIGLKHPLAFYANCHGTGKMSDHELEILLKNSFNLSPRSIREALKLNQPIYKKTAAYGHFGRSPAPDGSFSWEKCDLTFKN